MTIAWKPNIRIDIDPDARKDYTLDFSEWLAAESGAISGYQVVASSSVTIEDQTMEGAEITFWISDVPVGSTERVTVRVTTDTGIVDDFSILFRGVQQ